MRNPLFDPERVYSLSFVVEQKRPVLRCMLYKDNTKRTFVLCRSSAESVVAELYEHLQFLNAHLGRAQNEGTPDVSDYQLLEVMAFKVGDRPWPSYPVSGYVFPTMRRWLGVFGAAQKGGVMHRPLPQSVGEAMQLTWRAVSLEQHVSFADRSKAFITQNGCFILQCFGDACDVGIYPDCDSGPESQAPTRYDCHNVDWLAQQLTLLAGLAALHDLAAAELWKE